LPAAGAVGSPTTLTAIVAGNTPPTGNVAFRDGTTLLGNASLSGGSAQIVTSTLAAGPHSFTAAYEGDARNFASTSAAIPYSVSDPAAPPTIAFTGWSDGQVLVANNFTYYTGGQIGLTMSAAYGNTIAEYTLYVDGTPNQRTINLPSFTTTTGLSDMQIGIHVLRVVAKDNRGNRATAMLQFVVNPSATPSGPANVAITMPTNGASILGNVRMEAAADATTTSMTYYADGTQVGFAGATPPFAATWTNPAAGTYSLVAIARNNGGGARMSAPVTVTVSPAPAVPPPTVSLTSPTSGQSFTSPPSIALAANASAGSGASLAKVEFYDGATLIGTVTSPPYQLTWTAAAVGSHVVHATAADSLGQSTQSADVSITVTSQPTLSVTLDGGINGSSVYADAILVSGRVQAPRNSGVTVNGQLAVLAPAGDFFVNDVAVVQGANTITITVTTQDGETVSSTLTVNRLGPPPVTVRFSMEEGLPDFATTIDVENPGALPVARIELDFNNDGVPDTVANSSGALSVSAQFRGPGLMTPTIRFKDSNGVVLQTVARKVYVWSAREVSALVKGVYTDTLDRLRLGNSALALKLFLPQAQSIYDEIFQALGSDLPSLADQLGTFDSVAGTMTDAEAAVLRDTASGRQAFFIHLIRGGDGIWRIESM
jgi:Bacterial Ig-like domain (group 3)/Bacterial Ig domain/Glucodextranase, domain B